MRTVACKELAEDQDALQRVLHQYEMVEASATPAVVMYPSMPSISRLKRLWGGGKIYMTFDKIIQDRKRTGRREDDPLQTLLDLGDNTVQIITVSKVDLAEHESLLCLTPLSSSSWAPCLLDSSTPA